MRLRKLEEKDIPGMLEWTHDDNVNCYFRFDGANMKEPDVEKFIASCQSENDSYHFAIIDDKDEYLGTVSLKNVDSKSLVAEYAIVLRTSAHRTGVGAFATDKILLFAFEILCLNRVYLNVLSDNAHATHFYEKIGFIFEGEFRNHLVLRGEQKNLKWYSLIKEKYSYPHGGGGGNVLVIFFPLPFALQMRKSCYEVKGERI